jgi:hydroxypyruvate reductase/glycerate 2-kinase
VSPPPAVLREHARAVWQAAVDAARPQDLVRDAFRDPDLGLREAVARARRILVVGAGKAGAAMSAGVAEALADARDRALGLVNVPADAVALQPAAGPIRLHAARPAGSNFPTAEGVAGARHILELARGAGPDDVALCLVSGGGSALLPAPVEGVSLEGEQQVTALLHASGATINEMNAVRKHISAVKGGRLAEAFAGRALYSLIISDVVGDPLDVIASGPTAPDPTTFADALAVLARYGLTDQAPAAVRDHLRRGAAGRVPETPKSLPAAVHNHIIGNNVKSLAAAQRQAQELGYRVLNLGSFIEGETAQVGTVLAGLVRSVRREGLPLGPPACLLSGGETTVTLGEGHGLGGRNQELVLAAAVQLGAAGMAGVVVLSGGTDGEDGPTDAAGAVADEETLPRAAARGLDARDYLARHDAYHFFEATGGLVKTGLTQTNVTDVRVILVA